ncbi:MAG: sigma-70 family RNA polymerase sigma factor [Vicinamibacteria bacterium]|nr:sigma-70 family RNA polymerase sigma factor [Vicinamibacteria bacterium]
MSGLGETPSSVGVADDEGFRTLVTSHARSLHRLAYRMTRNEQDAEDVVQEALLKAYRGLERFENRSEMSTWLHRITTNCAYDLLRKRQRRAEDDFPETDAEADAVTTSLVSSLPGPDQTAHALDIRRLVNESMERMSATERTAFVLRHFEGHTLEHIGATLGISLAATKQSVFRAVRKVRQDLEPLVQAS